MRRCRKIRFRTELDAKIALVSTQVSDKPKRRECRAYRCPICKGWHLTSQERKT